MDYIYSLPIWKNVKRRVAKKYLKRYASDWMLDPRAKVFANLKPGDIVNTCSGFNNKIKQIIPYYFAVGKGQVLFSIDLVMEKGSVCDAQMCGVEPARSREDIEAEMLQFYKQILKEERFFSPKDKEITEKNLAILESGGHIADENGMRLKV